MRVGLFDVPSTCAHGLRGQQEDSAIVGKVAKEDRWCRRRAAAVRRGRGSGREGEGVHGSQGGLYKSGGKGMQGRWCIARIWNAVSRHVKETA